MSKFRPKPILMKSTDDWQRSLTIAALVSEFNITARNSPITKDDLNIYLYFEQFQKPW